jgi:hypothetical protein
MSISRYTRQNPFELTKESSTDILDKFRDWDDGMKESFNGTPYPKEFPRSKHKGSVYLNNKHMDFFSFKRWVCEKYLTNSSD